MPKNAFAKSQNRLDDPVPVAGVYGPTTGLPPETWYDKAEQLSYGLGAGGVRQLEGYKQLLTHPVQSVREIAAGMLAAAKDPSLVANALSGMWGRATANPEGFGSVVGENLNPRNLLRNMTRPNVREITTYHGTPHRFPATEANPLGEFDASKIGTGEGAQAYGHGIYVAESPGTGLQYKHSTSANMYETPKGTIRSSDLVDELFKASGEVPKQLESAYRAKANEVVRDLIMGKSSSEIAEQMRASKYGQTYKGLIKAVDELAPKPAEGSLYHVDLPDPMIEKMLDWDKPLSEQPKVVREALAMIDPDTWHPSGNDFDANELGQSIYNRLMHQSRDFGIESGKSANTTLHGAQAKASEDLRAFGIPGIRYLDAGSRGATDTGRWELKFKDGTSKVFDFKPNDDVLASMGATASPIGTRNFVIFPGEEKNLKILKRE